MEGHPRRDAVGQRVGHMGRLGVGPAEPGGRVLEQGQVVLLQPLAQVEAKPLCQGLRGLSRVDEYQGLLSRQGAGVHHRYDAVVQERELLPGVVGVHHLPVQEHALLEDDGAEVRRHVGGVQPLGDLHGVLDGGREGDDLALGIDGPDAGQEDLQCGSSRGVVHQVDLVRHDDGQLLDPVEVVPGE